MAIGDMIIEAARLSLYRIQSSSARQENIDYMRRKSFRNISRTELCRNVCIASILLAAAHSSTAAPDAADRSITIYNENYGIVRQTLPLSLNAGVNHIVYDDLTNQLVPSTVILRDPSGKRSIRVLEQNYKADDLSSGLLLSMYEGKSIDFQVTHGDHTEIVHGKIIRSGYIPPASRATQSYGYFDNRNRTISPIVDVDGKLQFRLPGIPLFPSIPADSILKPTLDWQIQTDTAGPLHADLSYETKGLTWSADYNLVSHDDSGKVDLTGWVTLVNNTGKTFEDTQIKLMAGDVHKYHDPQPMAQIAASPAVLEASRPPVTERAFDEYHLYTLQNRTTLRDRETKQVEFIRATGVPAETLYVYDGQRPDMMVTPGLVDNFAGDSKFGPQMNWKVWVIKVIHNSEANQLGIPLPKGKLRFYRKDTEPSPANSAGQLEFAGEDTIDHTARNEALHVYLGNAFDIVGERHKVDSNDRSGQMGVDVPAYIRESFEIKIRNHKAVPVDVQVLEHLDRESEWIIPRSSQTYLKTDAHTIQFMSHIAPGQERTITYTVRYTVPKPQSPSHFMR